MGGCRYSVAGRSAAAGRAYGQLMEELLQLKLAVEGAHAAATAVAARPSGHPQPPHREQHQAGLQQAASALAARALALLRGWQAAVLQLDAWRAWNRQQQQQAARAQRSGQDDGVLGPSQRCVRQSRLHAMHACRAQAPIAIPVGTRTACPRFLSATCMQNTLPPPPPLSPAARFHPTPHPPPSTHGQAFAAVTPRP